MPFWLSVFARRFWLHWLKSSTLFHFFSHFLRFPGLGRHRHHAGLRQSSNFARSLSYPCRQKLNLPKCRSRISGNQLAIVLKEDPRVHMAIPESAERRRAAHLANVRITDKMRDGLATSPITQPNEANCHAKRWSICDPSGEVHEFSNLAHFVRTHPDLFDPDDLVNRTGRPTSYICRATVGLGQLRPEKKMKVNQWKGWTWHE